MLRILENVFERLGPGDAVVRAVEAPQLLQEVDEGAVRGDGVAGVHGAVVADEGVGGDVGDIRNAGAKGLAGVSEVFLGVGNVLRGGNPRTLRCEIVKYVTLIAVTGECDAVFRGGHVDCQSSG